MDLVNQWDSKYCLAKFNGFKLSSAQITVESDLAKIFSLTNPGNPNTNPELTLIAEANSVVFTPTCKLSNADEPTTYKQYCTISLRIEVFIGTVSFGYYNYFDFNVYNECLSISSYKPPSNYDMWLYSSDPDSFKPFVY